MRPAVEYLYSRRYQDDKIEKSLESLGREVVEFTIQKIIKSNEINATVLNDITNRLRSTRFILGFPKERMSNQKNENYYKDLKLSGNESYMETCREFHSHHTKMKNEPKKSWRRKLDAMTFQSDVEYYADDSALCKLDNLSPDSKTNKIVLKIFHRCE